MSPNNAATPRKPAGRTSVPPHGRTSPVCAARCTEIEFPGKVPGNNGRGGLLRMHWARKAKLLATCIWVVKSEYVRRKYTGAHAGPVRLELIRYSTGRPMDYDNLVSTGKLLLDAVVRAGVLPDDNPAIITERRYTQERAESKEAQRTVLRITDLATRAQPA